VRFRREDPSRDSQLYYVDAAVLTRRLEPLGALHPVKVDEVRAQLRHWKSIHAPRVAPDTAAGVVRVIDGRHRLAVLVEQGGRIAVEVYRHDYDALRTLLSGARPACGPKPPTTVRVTQDGHVSLKRGGRWRRIGSLLAVVENPRDFNLSPRELAFLEAAWRRA